MHGKDIIFMLYKNRFTEIFSFLLTYESSVTFYRIAPEYNIIHIKGKIWDCSKRILKQIFINC